MGFLDWFDSLGVFYGSVCATGKDHPVWQQASEELFSGIELDFDPEGSDDEDKV